MGLSGELEGIVLHRLAVPLVAPIRAAHGIETVREAILIEARGADGTIGWGECSALARPTYTSEYIDGAWKVLVDLMVPAAMTGSDMAVVGHPMAAAALEGAFLDMSLRHRGERLFERIARRLGPPRSAIRRTVVIDRRGRDGVMEAVRDAIEGGAAAVKLKVTSHPDDLATVRAVRAEHPDLPLAVDGNGTLDARSAAILDEFDLIYIEQPFPGEDLVGSASQAKRLRSRIALDESITSVGAVEAVAALGAGSILNVKPARLGGIDRAIEVAQRAEELGLACFVGGMFETGVGRSTALALASSKAFGLPTDLGPTDYLVGDPAGPVTVDVDGRVLVPSGAGIGIEPDRNALEAVAVDSVVIR